MSKSYSKTSRLFFIYGIIAPDHTFPPKLSIMFQFQVNSKDKIYEKFYFGIMNRTNSMFCGVLND